MPRTGSYVRGVVGVLVAAQPLFLRVVLAKERAAESKYDRRAHVPGVTILALWCADGMVDHRVRKEVVWDRNDLSR